MQILRSRSLAWIIAAGAIVALTGIVILPQLFGSNEDSNSAASPASVVAVSPQNGSSDTITKLEKIVEERPNDFVAHINLAYAYLQRVRETGDPSLYSTAENVLKRAEKIGPGDPEVFAAKAVLALARHDFAAALVFADKALEINPDQARYYGLRADAQIELGQYEQAAEALQNMADRRPDFAAYSRIAHIRELYGDPEGAIEALQAAIEGGSSVPENMAWAFVQSGDRSFELGDFATAGAQYARALARMIEYPAALAGQARLAVVLGQNDTAASLYARAFARAPLAEYAIALGELHAKTGNQKEATKQFALVNALDKLQRQNGVNTDLELALFRADHGIELKNAVGEARAAYEARPSIYAADALAWSLFKNGNANEARRYSLEAIRLGTQNPLLLYHAGVIAQAVGENVQARELLRVALRPGPAFSLLYGDDAKQRLEVLEKATSRP